MRRSKHGPVRLSTYSRLLAALLEQVRLSGFVADASDLSLSFGEGGGDLEGNLICAGGLVIEIGQRLALVGEGASTRVQIVGYRYHVKIPGIGNVFRYEGPHPRRETGPAPPPHHDHHHVHRYDILRGDLTGKVEIIPNVGGVPTLREAISEAADWFYEHIDEILRLTAK